MLRLPANIFVNNLTASVNKPKLIKIREVTKMAQSQDSPWWVALGTFRVLEGTKRVYFEHKITDSKCRFRLTNFKFCFAHHRCVGELFY